MNKLEIARFIDHTNLSPIAGVNEIIQLCQEAKKYNFASVCINPQYVSLAATQLVGTETKVCTVVGFPLGASTTKDKIYEAKNAIKNGADEIDMVLNIGAARDGRFTGVSSDIAQVVKACKKTAEKLDKTVIVKVILETCYLDDLTIINCCLCAKKAGADFVKTSTGFATPKTKDGKILENGATEHHIMLMRKAVGQEMGVKASGGIRTVESTKKMLKAGATRIGTSSGVSIVQNWDEV